MKRPNILWICSDQQRWDTLGCYGNTFVDTPNLDRLAGQGALFGSAYCQSPVCTPSRASFLTGRYPRTTRCRQNGQDIPGDEVLVTKILADQGYTCGLSGKLHLSACFPTVCPEMEERIDDGYTDFHWSHHAGGGWGRNNAYWDWLREKGAFFETAPRPDTPWVRMGMPEELHQTTWCVEKACDFVRQRTADAGPWIFSINMYDPHHGFDPPEESMNRYMDRLDAIPLPPYHEGELTDKPPYQAFDHAGAYGQRAGHPYEQMTEKDHRMVRAAYWAMCDLIDAQVGRLLDLLEETGQIENTIVIYTSDHGEMLGDHGIYLKGPYFYEPAVHVPLIISCPGSIVPKRVTGIVELMDLAQTILDAAGVKHHPGMQGKSLWPILTGQAPADCHHDDVYCEYYNAMPWHQDPSAQLTMVRTDRYKIVVDHSNSGGELYDLDVDPGELSNLWNDPAARDVKTDMLLRLCNRMAWTVDPMPERRADW